MANNLGALLSFLVAFQLFFVGLYLFTNSKGNKRNNRILALLFLMFAANLADFSIRVSGNTFPIPLLHLTDDCFFLLYGPLLYFYVQAVVYRDFIFKRKDGLHLLPFISIAIFLIFQILSVDQQIQNEFTERMIEAKLPIWVYGVNLGIYFHILSYLYFSRRTLKAYDTAIKDAFSNLDAIRLDWLNFIIRTFFAITILAMINNIMPVFGNLYFLYSSIVVLLLFSFYFINRVLVKALNQPALFSGIAKDETEKYATSNLKPEEIEHYKTQLVSLMETEALYLNEDLKSTDLADRLDISTKVLSQVINQGFGQNFFDFVNTFRCGEVKRLLEHAEKKTTIIEAMYQSGFNSKSSFNKEFKKLTGQTPSEYRKSISQA